MDAIDTDKGYIDKLANMAGFMMTTFNTQHKAGYGITGSSIDTTKHDINFYGADGTNYTWDDTNRAVSDGTNSLKGVQIINAMTVNSKLTGNDGASYLAVAANTTSGTADGTNAVNLSALFNSTKNNTVDKTTARSIGDISLNNYYNESMTNLGSLSEAMNSKVSAQGDIMTQVESWRSSTSGVNWNEELTNMIKFQQGFSACSRCLTTMDEMLDKLVNSTGTVGR